MPSALERVFYAEDEDDIRMIATLALKTFGKLEVEACDSGVGIIEKALNFKPDLFLLDVMMPDVDGVAALKLLKECDALKHIPVVFMTAKIQPEEVARFKELGAFRVLSKPFDPQHLSDQLQDIWTQFYE